MDLNFADLIPVTAIAASAWVAVTLIRFWYRDRAPKVAGSGALVGQAEENARLAHENESLRLTIRRLEERLGVLERIATDPAERTAREIEQLR
jgi:hypothetical protein